MMLVDTKTWLALADRGDSYRLRGPACICTVREPLCNRLLTQLQKQ